MTKSYPQRREQVIDIARGAAMLLVCLSHFTIKEASTMSFESAADYLIPISMVASPGFVILSATLLGFVFVTRPDGFGAFRLKLADRALFLLTIGHFALISAVLPLHAAPGLVLSRTFITDALAIAILVVPWTLPRMRPGVRVRLGTAGILACWAATLSWNPRSPSALVMKGLMFGSVGSDSVSNFPILPWTFVYLVSTALGERLGDYLKRGEYAAASRCAARQGATMMSLAVCIRLLRLPLLAGLAEPGRESLIQLTSIWQKYPPGPAYLLFFGGSALCMLAGVVELWRIGLASWLTERLTTIGRSSFFVFVVQFYIYLKLLPSLRLTGHVLWPLWFALTLVLVSLAASVWTSRDANRFLTVGLPLLSKRLANLWTPPPDVPFGTSSAG